VAEPDAGSKAASPEHERQLLQLREQMANPELPFHEASFSLFGLDDRWIGLRWRGGHGRSNGDLHQLTLGHGDAPWDGTQPRVDVQTRMPRPVHHDPETDLAIERHTLTREQVGRMWHDTGELPADIRAAAFDPDRLSADPMASWQEIDLLVDNRSLAFKAYSQDETWVAQGQHGEILIALHAHDYPLDATGLVTVDEGRLRAYEDGTRQIREMRARGMS